jgi:hypothetical protein
MNANSEMSGIRELTSDEVQNVSGGNPILAGIAAFVGSYLATKTLDAMSEGDGWIQQAQKYGEQKKGGGSPK